MKKILGWIIIIFLSVGAFFLVEDKKQVYNIGSTEDRVEIKIRFKGLKGAVDFVSLDHKIYVAFPNGIKCIENDKEPYIVLSDKTLNISCIDIIGDNIYFISNSKLMSFNIKNKNMKEVLSKIPNNGDYSTVLLRGYKEKLFLTLGSMTNSGIVGEDNLWTKENEEGCDLSPNNIKVKESLKGAFVKKGESNEDGQVIKGVEVGNSSIIVFDTNTTEFKTYAWGIRNIKGIDITEEGKIYATVGGYEPRGERPIYNDSDYIYEIKENYWYGFPDYSGGDSLDSPRFNIGSSNKVNLVLSEIPMNPPAPYYQYNNINSLEWIAIDERGKIAKNNERSIFLYNKENNSIYYGVIGGIFEKFIEMNSNCTVSSMKIIDNELYILDSSKGFLFTIDGKE